MLVRPADAADDAQIGQIAAANGQPPEDSGRDPRYLAHLRIHGHVLVAEFGDRLAGFAATRQADRVTLLCDLFVDPRRHGSGIGHRLLDAAFDGSADRVTFSSQDPRALPLYARYGLSPRWPLLYLRGNPAGVTATAQDRAAGPASARLVDSGEAAAAERALADVDRGPDYQYWGSLPGSSGLLIEQDRQVIAAGVTSEAKLRHLAVGVAADAATAVLAALPVLHGPAIRLCLPGPHPALATLLRAGFLIDDFDHYMSNCNGLISVGDVLSSALA